MDFLSEQAYQNRRPHDGIVIGYASGTPTHNKDFALVKPALQQLMQQYPQVRLCLLGSLDPGDDWGELTNRIETHPLVLWRELPAVQSRFDINLAPLRTDNPFAQSKSEIKYMEAALLRIPTIASPTAAFQYAIRDGDNGFLVDDDWLPALQKLVEDPDRCQRVGQNAYQDVQLRYHPLVRAGELVATLQAISLQLHSQPLWEQIPFPAEQIDLSSFQTPESLERSPSLLRLGWHNLRYRGPRTLLLQGWIFFRRLIAPLVPYHRHA